MNRSIGELQKRCERKADGTNISCLPHGTEHQTSTQGCKPVSIKGTGLDPTTIQRFTMNIWSKGNGTVMVHQMLRSMGNLYHYYKMTDMTLERGKGSYTRRHSSWSRDSAAGAGGHMYLGFSVCSQMWQRDWPKYFLHCKCHSVKGLSLSSLSHLSLHQICGKQMRFLQENEVLPPILFLEDKLCLE